MSSAIAGNREAPDHAEATVDRLIALDALRSLRSLDREALLLIAWDGLTEKQAAQALRCSRGAFALRLYRARGRLRELIQQRTADEEPLSTQMTSVRAAKALPLQAFEESI